MKDQSSFMRLVLGVALFGIGLAAASQQPPSEGKPVNQDHAPRPEIAGVDRAREALLRRAQAPTPVNAVVPVLTRAYDNLRSGANTRETRLTLAAVPNTRQLFTIVIGGDQRGVEAQPLLVPNVPTVDGTSHDLLVLASMGDQVAAYDAHDGTPIWLSRLGVPIRNNKNIDYWLINDHWGVLSTGVIDAGQEVLYVVAWVSPDGSSSRAVHSLYAISLKDGSRVQPPLPLDVASEKMQRKQRASLTLVGNTLFVPWGTIQETAVGAHGYITAVNLTTWKVEGEYSVTSTGNGGGIWQAGQGLISDGVDLFFMTGNGDFNGTTNLGESFVRLHYADGKFTVIGSYAPFRDAQRNLDFDDMDLGSGAPSLIPDLGVLFGAGKDGIAYFLDAKTLKPKANPIWFTFFPGREPAVPRDQLYFDRTHHMHSTPVVWKTADGWRAFCWGENGNLRAWSVTSQGLRFLANGQEVASAQAPVPPGGMPGGMLTLSSNGVTDGVLWATVPLGDANSRITTGYLAAYDVTTFGKYADGTGSIRLLWKSNMFVFDKFMPPVVSGGRVYVPTYDGQVFVFGVGV